MLRKGTQDRKGTLPARLDETASLAARALSDRSAAWQVRKVDGFFVGADAQIGRAPATTEFGR